MSDDAKPYTNADLRELREMRDLDHCLGDTDPDRWRATVAALDETRAELAKVMAERDAANARAEKAEARVAELEAALREIKDGSPDCNSQGVTDSSMVRKLGLWIQAQGVSIDGLPSLVFPRLAAMAALSSSPSGSVVLSAAEAEKVRNCITDREASDGRIDEALAILERPIDNSNQPTLGKGYSPVKESK